MIIFLTIVGTVLYVLWNDPSTVVAADTLMTFDGILTRITCGEET